MCLRKMRTLLVATLASSIFLCVSSLTCYNGLKLIRGQNVGQQTEECPSGAMCYNMTSSAAFVVDVVKAGCSQWRCMMARDRCIGININFVPVSLCCCSTDRCNVDGNPQYSSNVGGGSGYGGGGYGGGGYGGGGNSGGGWDNNQGGNSGGGWNNNQGGGGYGGGGYGGGSNSGGGWDNNNKNNQGSGGGGWSGNNNNNNNQGSGYGGGYGGYGSGGDGNVGKIDVSGSNTAPGKKGNMPSRKEFEESFRNFNIDARDDGEETFQKIDVRKTTPRPRTNSASSKSSGGVIEV